MKTLFLFLLIPSALFAAEAVSTGNATADSILTWITPVVVPLVLTGVKRVLPKLPSFMIPILAPVLGVAIDFVNTFALGHSSNLALAAVAGLAGVGLREVKENLKPSTNGGWPVLK